MVTPARIASGKKVINDCLELLTGSGRSFEFLAHVEGDLKIEVHVNCNEDDSDLEQITEALAEEVLALS